MSFPSSFLRSFFYLVHSLSVSFLPVSDKWFSINCLVQTDTPQGSSTSSSKGFFQMVSSKRFLSHSSLYFTYLWFCFILYGLFIFMFFHFLCFTVFYEQFSITPPSLPPIFSQYHLPFHFSYFPLIHITTFRQPK